LQAQPAPCDHCVSRTFSTEFTTALYSTPAQTLRCLLELEQMAILPVAFLGNGSVSVNRINRISDGRCCVNGGSNRMGGNVRGGHCLTRRTGSRASCMIPFDFTSSRVRPKSSRAYDSHLEDPGAHPGSACVDRPSRARVLRVLARKISQDTFSAITGPDCQRFMVGFRDQLPDRLI
jgi:hypothetical protein